MKMPSVAAKTLAMQARPHGLTRARFEVRVARVMVRVKVTVRVSGRDDLQRVKNRPRPTLEARRRLRKLNERPQARSGGSGSMPSFDMVHAVACT